MKKPLCLITIMLSVAIGAFAQTKPRESLHGLHGVFVYVAPLDKTLLTGGLTAKQVQGEVESALLRAGITVFSEPRPEDGSSNLAFVIDIVKHPQGPIIYSVEISLLQEVRLARLPGGDSFPAQTWSEEAIGLTTASHAEVIMEPVKAKVEDFIRDYRAANEGAKQ